MTFSRLRIVKWDAQANILLSQFSLLSWSYWSKLRILNICWARLIVIIIFPFQTHVEGLESVKPERLTFTVIVRTYTVAIHRTDVFNLGTKTEIVPTDVWTVPTDVAILRTDANFVEMDMQTIRTVERSLGTAILKHLNGYRPLNRLERITVMIILSTH